MAEVTCPVIAEEPLIVAVDNLDSLWLNNYNRSVGTRVTVTCLSKYTHELRGSSLLTCLQTGQWDLEIPKCVLKQVTDPGGGTGDLGSGSGSQSSGYDVLPYITALAVLGVACILLAILLTYLLKVRRRGQSTSESGLFSSSRSSRQDNSDQTQFWVNMASSGSLRCHELAYSRDSMVENIRYTHLSPDWSGY